MKKRLGPLVDILSGFAFDSALFTSADAMPLIRIRDLGGSSTEANYLGPYRPEYVVENGDLLVGMDGDFEAVCWRGDRALLNQRVCKLSTRYPLELDQRYLYYSLIGEIKAIHAQVSATTVKHLSVKHLQEIEIRVPPPCEQCAIADILTTVDQAIEQTEALIAKQRRIKAGLLHDLLTRGIDEHGHLRDPSTHRFKPSPVGLVPEEWEVKPLTDLAEIGTGVTLGRTISGPDTIELPYLRVANVQDGYIDLSEVKKIRVYHQEVPRFLLQSGDVLMNEGGDYDKLGRGTVWRGQISPCLHQNHVFRVRTERAMLLPDFLALVSASAYGKRFFVLSSKQSTNLASINSTQLKAFPVPLPSAAEQVSIVKVLGASDLVMETEGARLAKLQRLKAGLMQDLLSGWVSVAELAVRGDVPHHDTEARDSGGVS
ncbi:MAG: restriction endonuclease subunit S [Anaerolineae bacterium]